MTLPPAHPITRAMLLGVEIQKNRAGHKTGLKAIGPYQALLLIYREKTLYWAVLKRVVKKNRHTGSASESVVSTRE